MCENHVEWEFLFDCHPAELLGSREFEAGRFEAVPVALPAGSAVPA
jgi:hypothetical protein